MRYFIFVIALVLAACEGVYEEDIDTDADTITDSIATETATTSATETTSATATSNTACDNKATLHDGCVTETKHGDYFVLAFVGWADVDGVCVELWEFEFCANGCEYGDHGDAFCVE